MELFFARDCPRSQAVRVFLEEKGVKCSLCHVDNACAQNLDPDFLRLSPGGDTPVLSDGGTVATGVVGIARYLDQLGGRLGAPAVDQRVEERWIRRLLPLLEEETLAYSLLPLTRAMMLIRFKRKVCIERMGRHADLALAYGSLLSRYQILDGQVNAGHAAEVARKELASAFKDVDVYLETNKAFGPYLAGSEISLADVILAVVLAKCHRLGLDKELLQKRTRLQEYWKKWRSRTSYRKVFGLVATTSAKATSVGSVISVRAKSLARRYA